MRRWPARLPFVIVVGAGKRIKVGKGPGRAVCGPRSLRVRHDPTVILAKSTTAVPERGKVRLEAVTTFWLGSS